MEDVPGAEDEPQGGTSLRGVLRRPRRRFVELVERQLELFEREQKGLLRDVGAALRGYNRASGEQAEERYGDFLDLVDTGREVLVEIREGYAATLDEERAAEYREVFNGLVQRRLPRFGLELG